MQHRHLATRQDRADQVQYQAPGIAPLAIVGVGADGADLAEAAGMQPLRRLPILLT